MKTYYIISVHYDDNDNRELSIKSLEAESWDDALDNFQEKGCGFFDFLVTKEELLTIDDFLKEKELI